MDSNIALSFSLTSAVVRAIAFDLAFLVVASSINPSASIAFRIPSIDKTIGAKATKKIPAIAFPVVPRFLNFSSAFKIASLTLSKFAINIPKPAINTPTPVAIIATFKAFNAMDAKVAEPPTAVFAPDKIPSLTAASFAVFAESPITKFLIFSIPILNFIPRTASLFKDNAT